MLSLARKFLFSPQEAAEAARDEKNFIPSLAIYVLVMTGFVLLYWLKPANFPDGNEMIPWETQDLLSGFKTMCWQPLLEGAWIIFLMGLALWFKNGSLPLRLGAATGTTAAAFAAIVLYSGANTIPRSALAACLAAWLFLFYPLTKSAPRKDWTALIIYMLGINAIGLPLIALLGAAIFLKLSWLFKASQIICGFWILGTGILGVRALTGLRLPRAFMAMIFSVLLQAAFAISLHFLGARGILKALLYG